MLISNQYRLDESTGRVVVDTPLGARLLPVGAAGFLHVLLFTGLFLIGHASGELHIPKDDAPQEVAFMVETYVEPVIEPEEVIEETPIEEIIEEEPVIEEEEIAEIIEEAVEPPKEEKKIEKPKPRIVPKQVEVKPPVKPVTPSKTVQPRPKAKVVAQTFTTAPVKKVHAKTGFIKPVYPAYLRNPAPPYPKSAKRRRLEGVVELKVLVSAEGKVLNLSIFKSCGHSALDRSALQTVRNWRFLPAKRNGKAVNSDVIVPIRFQLRT